MKAAKSPDNNEKVNENPKSTHIQEVVTSNNDKPSVDAFVYGDGNKDLFMALIRNANGENQSINSI